MKDFEETIDLLHKERKLHVPSAVFSDLYFGVIQPGDEGFQEWIEHIRCCESCHRVFMQYLRQDQLTTLEKLPEMREAQVMKRTLSSIEEAAKVFEECVNQYKADMKVVSGEFNWKVYTPKLRDAIVRVLDEHEDSFVELLGGPIVSVPESGDAPHKNSIMPELARHPKVRVFSSPVRQTVHFRVANDAAYVERSHGINNQGQRESIIYYGHLPARIFQRRFDVLLRQPNVQRSKDPEKDFIFLDDTQIKELETKLSPRSIDDLNAEQVKEALTEFKIGDA